MKNCLRPLPVLLALAFVGALASCGNNADAPGAVNAARNAPKAFIAKESGPATGTGQDLAVAGLHRNTSGRPTGEQHAEHADERLDHHHHDGQADR